MATDLVRIELERSRPSLQHELRVDALEDLALLMSFSLRICSLPDRSRPDVFRFDAETGGVFIGEAKETEEANCKSTRGRYRNYVSWLSASEATIASSVCGICFGNYGDNAGWKGLLIETLVDCDLVAVHPKVSRIAHSLTLVWTRLSRSTIREPGAAAIYK
jgi:hypothetical protein